MTSLSVIIPTVDPTRPLRRCLKSIAMQPLRDGDEVIVVHDTQKLPLRGQPLDPLEEAVRDLGPPFRYLRFWCEEHGHLAGHCYGHDQINFGVKQARGEYLTFIDDDDVFVPDAFDAIRAAADALPEPRPLMFKFIPWFRQVLWAKREIVFQEIGGHCFVPPNIPGRLGKWTADYTGDYFFIRSTVDLWPNKDADVVWCDTIISLARPDQ